PDRRRRRRAGAGAPGRAPRGAIGGADARGHPRHPPSRLSDHGRGRGGRHQPLPRRGGPGRPSPRADARVARGAIPGDHLTAGGGGLSAASLASLQAQSEAQFRRLVAAELLKLRRRRTLLVASVALIVAPMAVSLIVLTIP